jgi:site-specific DNA recombinase
MTTCAVYARKSNEQVGVSDEVKSVGRQIQHARAYAEKKGWTVAEDHIYSDDGVSGAEFVKRPGFIRLMNALKPKPAFQVLIMSEESRLGREQLETGYVLKQLICAGVRIFFYLEDKERTLDSPTDKLMMSVANFAAEMEREKARQRTYDAMRQKAQAGYVTGGRTFGYDNEVVYGAPDAQGRPRRSHVELRINDGEAEVVRKIFALYAQGKGFALIAKHLNDCHAPCPRPRPSNGKPSGWAPSSVRQVLIRPIYRGEILWGKTKKRDPWGVRRARRRPEREWLRIPAPALRIIPEELWQAAQERLTAVRAAYLRGTDGQLWGRPANGIESKYLLGGGLTRCGECGSSLYVVSRSHGKRRVYLYQCTANRLRGRTSCANNHLLWLEEADEEIVTKLLERVLVPEVIREAARKAALRACSSTVDHAARRQALDAELAGISAEIDNLAAAIAKGGRFASLLGAVEERERRREQIGKEMARLERETHVAKLDDETLYRELVSRAQDWDYVRSQLRGNLAVARQLLRKIFPDRITFTPRQVEGQWMYQYAAQAQVGGIVSGILGVLGAKRLVSPTGGDIVAATQTGEV